MLPNGIDIAVLVVIGVFVFLGWKNGLVKMGFRMLSHLAALLLAWIFHSPLAAFLAKTPLYEKMVSIVIKQNESVTEVQVTAGFLRQLLAEGKGAIENSAVEYFASLLLNGISFFAILILARVLLILAGRILNFMVSLPVIGFLNRGLGMVIGALEGLLVVCILFTVFYVVPPLRENMPLGYAIEQSVVARELCLHNPVLQSMIPKEKTETVK